jgi:hypothetical protein
MMNEAKGETHIVPGYEKVKIFGHLLTIDGRQVYHHKGRGEFSIEDRGRHLVGLGEREQAILEHALEWAKEGE